MLTKNIGLTFLLALCLSTPSIGKPKPGEPASPSAKAAAPTVAPNAPAPRPTPSSNGPTLEERSVTAAEHAAQFAWYSFWVAALGAVASTAIVIVAVVQMAGARKQERYTKQGLRYARDAVELSKAPVMCLGYGGIVANVVDRNLLQVYLQYMNLGDSPALDFVVTCVLQVPDEAHITGITTDLINKSAVGVAPPAFGSQTNVNNWNVTTVKLGRRVRPVTEADYGNEYSIEAKISYTYNNIYRRKFSGTATIKLKAIVQYAGYVTFVDAPVPAGESNFSQQNTTTFREVNDGD